MEYKVEQIKGKKKTSEGLFFSFGLYPVCFQPFTIVSNAHPTVHSYFTIKQIITKIGTAYTHSYAHRREVNKGRSYKDLCTGHKQSLHSPLGGYNA